MAESQIDQTVLPEEKKVNRLRMRINLGVAGFLISLLALLSTPVIYILDKNKDYKSTQHAFQPFYNVVKVEPHYILKIESNPFRLIDSSAISADDFQNLGVSIAVAIRYHLKNIGTAKARSWFQMFRDTMSGEQVLNDFIQKNNQTENYIETPPPFFSHNIININDTFSILDTVTIESFADSNFAIHAIFIYENDFEQFYYSYYTALFEFNPFDIVPGFDSIRKEPYLKYTKYDLENAVRLLEDNCTPHAYSKKEKRRVYKFLRSRGWIIPG